MSDYPVRDPEVLRIYAGDDVIFGDFIFDESLSGWGSWAAAWRPFTGSSKDVALTVDTSGSGDGRIRVTATAANTRLMDDLRRGDSLGVWDLQATHGTHGVRTWIWGETSHQEDVYR